jgi:hypothetical protein
MEGPAYKVGDGGGNVCRRGRLDGLLDIAELRRRREGFDKDDGS